MITNIWLKSQPNKKIAYPECYPVTTIKIGDKQEINIIKSGYRKEATYDINTVSRVEFRP